MDLKVQTETGCALRQIRFALTAPGLGHRQRSIESGSDCLGVCGPITLGQRRSWRFNSIFSWTMPTMWSCTPSFRSTFETAQPPLLAVWGKFDPYFIPTGAEALKRDLPAATVKFLPTGHFALETHLQESAIAMREFLMEHREKTVSGEAVL
jgi:pimeloyl-ACP methyl ester carboxylesterase